MRFTAALGLTCQLRAFVPDAAALNVPFHAVHSSLQNATPFHLTTEESLADLNRRLSTPGSTDRRLWSANTW